MYSKLRVLEDCSPFYIRFTFDKLDSIVQFVISKLDTLRIRHASSYSHKDFPIDISEEIISLLPKNFAFEFIVDRVSIFDTPPGGGCGIHKDGKDHRVSFNIPIEVHDNLCTTYWYDNDQFNHSQYDIQKLKGYTRNIYYDHHSMNKFTHSKSMVASTGEMILFNTEIFHSWKNESLHPRKILTLRVKKPGLMYFDNAKKILNL